jgi:CRISPR/Cas system CSM-associated protein Csm2 small subunit
MDKFIKRLQTRASRKGINVSKSQVRDIYTQVVVEPESPSDEEMSAVIQQLENQYQAPSYQASTDLATTEESAPIQQPEEPQEMTPAQPTAQPSTSTLATSSRSGITQASSGNLAITQEEIQQAVEQQFGKENVETKTAILNYVCKDVFSTSQELQHALAKLRQTKLNILLKLINDHNQAASSDAKTLKTALLQASEQRQRETEDFFGSFENQLLQMRTTFGV